MASLARCIAKSGKNISRDDQADLMDRYEQARKDGYGEREAGVIAAGSLVDEAAAQVEAVVEAVREAGVDAGVTVDRGDAVQVQPLDTTGARRDRVQQVAERAWGKKLVRALVDRGVLTFASAEEVAAAVPELSAEQIRKEGIRGVYANGKAYVVTDVVPDSAVAGVVLHEVGVHFGLERMVGQKALKALLYDLGRLRNTDKAVGAAYAKAEKAGSSEAVMDEEALGYLTESAPNHSIVQRLIESIKRFLKSLGVPVNVLSTEAAAIRDMAVDALRAAGMRDADTGPLVMAGAIKFHRAFHGSPHDFDKFDSSKIGTGEGAQAYGHGLYFAGKKAVAEFYRKALSNDEASAVTNFAPATQGAWEHKKDSYGYETWTNGSLRIGHAPLTNVWYVNVNKHGPWAPNKPQQELWIASRQHDSLSAAKEFAESYAPARSGKLYEVELTPQEGDYLDWDKPLSEQSEKVRKALATVAVGGKLRLRDGMSLSGDAVLRIENDEDFGPRYFMESGNNKFRLTEADVANLIGEAGKEKLGSALYSEMTDRLGSQAAASKALHAAGIPGIRYKDATARGTEKESHNYVIFDDSLVEVKAKFSKGEQRDQTSNTGAFSPTNPDIRYSKTAPDPVLADMRAKANSIRQQAAALAKAVSVAESDITDVAKRNERISALTIEAGDSLAKALNIDSLAAELRTRTEEASILAKWATDPKATQEDRREALRDRDKVVADVAAIREDVAAAKQAAVQSERAAEKARKIGGPMDATAMAKYRQELLAAAEKAAVAWEKAAKLRDWMAGRIAAVRKAREDASGKKAAVAQEAELRGQQIQGGAITPISFDPNQKRWEGWRGQLRRLRGTAQDKFLSFLYAKEDIERVRGALNEAADVHRRENLMHGRVGDQVEQLKRKHVDPLLSAMRLAGVKPADLEQYLYARHAAERNARIAKLNPSMPDGGSGMTTEAASQVIAALETPAMKALAERVYKITKQTRQTLVDSGLITREQFNALEAMYQDYVPLRGKDGVEVGYQPTGGGVDVRGQPIKLATGRGAGNLAKNILAETIADAQRAIIQAEKARVGRTALRLVLENPNDAVWEVEPVETENRVSEASGTVYEAVRNISSDPGTVVVPFEGKRYRIKFRDPRMAAAMKNLGADEFAAVSKYLGWYNRMMSGLLTRYNPAFTAVNLLRDATLGVTGVAAEHGTKTAAQVAGAYVPALNAMWKQARDKSGTGRWDKHATEYAAAGGKTSFTLMDSVEDLNLRVGDEFKKFGQIIREGRPAMAVMKAVRDSRLIHLIENVNDAVENAMRLATYGTLREKGMSVEQAAERAKNLTVNFNRRGSHASILNAMYLFFNASVQGTHRTLRLMKHPSVLATLGGLSALQIAATLLAMSIEDDDGERLWDKVSEYDKMRNLVFVVPYKDDDGKLQGRIVKWPMPYGFNMFPYAAGRLAKLGVDMKDDRTETAGREAAGMVNDMGTGALNAFSPVDLERGWDAFVPNIIRDFTALKVNRDDLGRPITAEQPFTKYDVPRAAMGKAETPAAFKGLARVLNRAGGGDDYTPPNLPMFFDWSPEDLQYLTEKFTGGVGRELGRTEQLAEKLIGGVEPSLNDIPIIRSLVADVNMRQATAGRYYDTRENIERELDRMKDAYVSGGQSAAEQALDDAGPVLEGVEFATYKRDGERDDGTYYEEGDIKLSETGRPEVTAESGTVYRTYKDTEAALEDMRQESRRIFNDSTLSFAERRKKLDELQVRREKAQREFNRRFNQERRTH